MKTQISRRSFKANQGYSGVYQQMGRMITDADWNELNDIVKNRLADALVDIIGSGIPRDNGLVRQISPDNYQLHWGQVYVDGIGAHVRPDSNNALAFNFSQQQDFPGAPALIAGEHKLYLDVWERTVTHLEDSRLLDFGLKGADTCTRTQVMAQVKSCSTDYSREDIEANNRINPPIGNQRVSLSIRQGQTLNDPCDPCSEELNIPEDIGNFLFRVEVHDVQWDENSDNPRVVALTLKWSSENGAEAYEVLQNPIGFKSSQWAYEFFSGPSDNPDDNMLSEKHLGHHLMAGFSAERAILTNGFTPGDAPGKNLVRRWDGFARFIHDSDGWHLDEGYDRGSPLSTGLSDTNHGYVDVDEQTVLNLEKIRLTIELDEPIAVAGDYWLGEVRETIHNDQPDIILSALPQGILHHYWTLGTVRVDDNDGENVITGFMPEEQLCQSFGFPPLTDITADDVCYPIPHCGDQQQPSVRSLLEKALGTDFPDAGSTSKVRAILDVLLCHHNATTLPLEKNEDLCVSLNTPEIHSVQDALNELCKREVDGCATFTVFPRPGWESVFKEIGRNQDARICFREGDYPLDEPITVKGKGHLTLSGAGKGTHIWSKNHEAALIFDNCASVSMQAMFVEGKVANTRDKQIEHLNGSVTFSDCASVNIEDITLKCASGISTAATCLTITNSGNRTGKATIEDSTFAVGHRQVAMLLLNLSRTHVDNNYITTTPKPKSLTIEHQLKDRRLAAQARKFLINKGTVRDFEEKPARAKKDIHMRSQGQRRIMIDSPIAANIWREQLEVAVGEKTVKTNQELLTVAKNVADKALFNKAFRAENIAFLKWFDALKMQNPSVSFKGIVCGGRSAKEVRIINNTLEGVQEGIHVGVSDKTDSKRYVAGRVVIENNTINVRIPPLIVHRRGGIYVGNCNHLSLSQNHISVQRFNWTSKTEVEAIRVYGYLGFMATIDKNYATGCTTGVRFEALNANPDERYQYLIADNMMLNTQRIVQSGIINQLVLRNNRN
ncbi:DUF6519 domain-containing protein [Vibrio sp. EA2]|uniref:DUF6519 domain-containing protein n=1 Tax=Vibrio sp. EA2 TaxID=3079860 RepID=UPI00294A2D9E|nr:DUF6519 domain-containing protein [Vibrio sp. EA2]MDV6250462.1 DUF6519 domain-containing protein [Vibrio sp. EA2]